VPPAAHSCDRPADDHDDRAHEREKSKDHVHREEDEVAQQQRDVVRLPDRDQRPETSLAGDRLVGHAEQAALEEREDEDHHTERDERDRRREYRAGRLHEQVRELKTPKSAVMSSTIGFRTTPLTAGRRAWRAAIPECLSGYINREGENREKPATR